MQRNVEKVIDELVSPKYSDFIYYFKLYPDNELFMDFFDYWWKKTEENTEELLRLVKKKHNEKNEFLKTLGRDVTYDEYFKLMKKQKGSKKN